MYLRQNIVQAVIGEFPGVSQPTVSRAIKAITAAISRTLAVPSAHRGGGARGLRLSWWTALSSPARTGAITAICGRSSTGARA